MDHLETVSCQSGEDGEDCGVFHLANLADGPALRNVVRKYSKRTLLTESNLARAAREFILQTKKRNPRTELCEAMNKIPSVYDEEIRLREEIFGEIEELFKKTRPGAYLTTIHRSIQPTGVTSDLDRVGYPLSSCTRKLQKLIFGKRGIRPLTPVLISLAQANLEALVHKNWDKFHVIETKSCLRVTGNKLDESDLRPEINPFQDL